ncbi:hypothetical protein YASMINEVIRUS_782 [Yasminevirus sp. GU-2018]|uniref:Lipase-like C-terminal domain-containing protein n=1 Tax=Yasminevirus sp. GU-2018 TaxID=2420051 RepID=A0A5K0U886_9VIRU|nr:hypothetical protein YASMINEVIRUS_782 [Yasminevirus sp. GU-2018]
MSYLDKRFFPSVEPLNNRYPCVFIPGIFSYRLFDYFSNPGYWGLASDVQSIEKNNNYYFANIGFFMSAHDAACHVFAQLFGGYADYGDEHAKKHKHPRFGSKFYPSSLTEWNSDRPIIIVCHSHGAMVAQKLQQLLADDFWGKGTDAGWIKSIITINGAMNGSPLVPALGITVTKTSVVYPFYLKIFLVFVHLLMYFLYVTGIGDFIVNLIDPFNITSLADALTGRTSIFNGTDNIVYDLGYEGAKESQKQYVKPYKETLYLNFTTNMNWTRYIPYPSLFVFFIFTNIYMNIFGTPKKYVNKCVDKVTGYINDGAVTVMSQQYPYLDRSIDRPHEEISLIDIHDQYANLKFKKADLDDSTLVKGGVYYYIDIKSKINNHLRATMDSWLLPFNDLFYRSVCDFVRQYIRHFELKALKVLADEEDLLLQQKADLEVKIHSDLDSKLNVLGGYLSTLTGKCTQGFGMLKNFMTVYLELLEELATSGHAYSKTLEKLGQVLDLVGQAYDSLAKINETLGAARKLYSEAVINPLQAGADFLHNATEYYDGRLTIYSGINSAQNFDDLMTINDKLVTIGTAFRGNYTLPLGTIGNDLDPADIDFVKRFVALTYINTKGLYSLKSGLTNTTPFADYSSDIFTVPVSNSVTLKTQIDNIFGTDGIAIRLTLGIGQKLDTFTINPVLYDDKGVIEIANNYKNGVVPVLGYEAPDFVFNDYFKMFAFSDVMGFRNADYYNAIIGYLIDNNN